MLLERLQNIAGLSEGQLERYAETASNRYKVYYIPKKNGGERKIEHPSRAIKSIQRWLNKTVISKFPVHACATAYQKGASIRENALRHSSSNFTLHADFKNYFPSFHGEHVEDFLRHESARFSIELNDSDIAFVRRIVCRNNALTIGAPSSPILTNAMMYNFDNDISIWCSNRDLIYSRYADDIYISSRKPDSLSNVLSAISSFSRPYRYARLNLNHDKTAFLSRRYKRSITGLIVTPTHELSVGRDRKTRIKAQVYAFQQGRLPREDWAHLRGILAFVMDVEPSFYSTLVRKYGEDTFVRLGR